MSEQLIVDAITDDKHQSKRKNKKKHNTIMMFNMNTEKL